MRAAAFRNDMSIAVLCVGVYYTGTKPRSRALNTLFTCKL